VLVPVIVMVSTERVAARQNDAMTAAPTPRPVAGLDAVDAAFAQFLAAVDTMTADQLPEPSRLPGWTRGHVLAHVARSGEGDALTVEATTRGEVGNKYPGGAEQRAADIESDSRLPLAELRAALVAMQQRLVDAWDALPDDRWDGLAIVPFGERTAAVGVSSRRREILVHLVDLDMGVIPTDLPADYLRDDADWIAEHRADWTVELDL